jgi:hypothetical protein
VGVPFQTNSNSFFEQIGVNFGFHVGNFTFQQNSAGLASPQFGGAVPNAGATTGFAIPLPGGGEAFFNITASQGSRASLTSQAASVTLSNGVQGGVFDTTQTPFVINPGIQGDVSPALARWQQLRESGAAVPTRPADKSAVDGAAPRAPAPARPAAATASGTLSVAQIRAMRAQQTDAARDALERETASLVERGREAEQNGKRSVARLYYQQAARRVTGPQRDELLEHARALADSQPAKKTRTSAAEER